MITRDILELPNPVRGQEGVPIGLKTGYLRWQVGRMVLRPTRIPTVMDAGLDKNGQKIWRVISECESYLVPNSDKIVHPIFFGKGLDKIDEMQQAGTVPTVENMPPVLRMRQGGFYFTPIGMASADLLWLTDEVPGLKIMPDTSHAGLYLNARGGATSDASGQPWLEPLLSLLRQLPEEAPDLLGYFQSLAPHLLNAQISNASGILGEGLPYGEGDFDLDSTIAWLADHAEHIVTETLEPDQDDARYMRDALLRMRAVVG